MDFTTKERKLLENLTKDCFWEQGYESCLWTDCFIESSGIKASSAKGILSSLKKKEAINISIGDDKSTCITLLPNGIQYLTSQKDILNLDDNGYHQN